MVAIGALNAQVRTQIVRKAIVTVGRNRRVAMRFGIAESADHPLSRCQIEQILRYVRPHGKGATKELPRPLL
jgi:hypothetical protein